MTEVTMPQLGETVTEGTITRWFKQVGDPVQADEILFEVSTDKVDSEVPSPIAGTLLEILANEGDTVEVGQVLAHVGDSSATPSPPSSQAPPSSQVPTPQAPPPQVPTPSPARPEQTDPGAVMSPVVRRLIADNQLDPAAIVGTGIGGRVTRADVEAVIRSGVATSSQSVATAPHSAVTQSAMPETTPAEMPRPTSEVVAHDTTAERGALAERDKIVALNNIRKRTAEHMVMSKNTSPHVLTAMEIDYEGVEKVRNAHKSAWKTEEGFGLTYLPFIARAVVDALREYPHLNASFAGDHLVLHDEVNLAIAVDIDFNGLLAPVLKGADGKRLRQIARDIVDVAARARTKQLLPDELSAGTFTLTNAGQYGTMMQFPIINQPQVAILSTDGVKRKPVVVTDAYGNESIAIHSIGVLAMAWDHRAFDGAYAAAFLHRVKEIIETRDWQAEVR